VVDRQPCLLEILDTGKLSSSHTSSGQKLKVSRCRPVSKPKRHVRERIRGFRLGLLVSSTSQEWRANVRITQRDTFDEIARLRETILRIKQPPHGISIPMVIVGSTSPTISYDWD
jgi:hypothetical protein